MISLSDIRNTKAIAKVVIKELYRRKDFYVLLILTGLICLIMSMVNIFNDDKIVRYLKELCLFFIWASSLIIAISTAARQIPQERESRTLFPLLAKPVTRTQFVLGKFFGCWVACGLALICFYLFFGVLAASREHHLLFVNWLQAAFLHWMMLAIVIALTLLGSLVTAAVSSNITIIAITSAAILTVGRHLNKVALQIDEPGRSLLYAIYYALPHLEVFDVRDLIIHNWPAIPLGICALAIAYASLYTTIFLLLACIIFKRKALN